MKKFKWIKVEHIGKETGHTLLEFLEENKVVFWASINTEPNDENKYKFVAFNKERSTLLTTVAVSSIDEARFAVEEFLSDQGVIERDEVE
jgi:hypothetical protein